MTPSTSRQTLTVQYNVLRIDGQTPSEPFSLATQPVDPQSQVFEVVQDAVGLIDPDQRAGGSMGDRFIPWIEVVLDEPGQIQISIVDGQDPDLVLASIVGPTAVVPGTPFFRAAQFRCPQGALIRVGDLAAPTGPGRVRLRIIAHAEAGPGAAGATGPAGPAGATGPAGPTGPTGASPAIVSAGFLIQGQPSPPVGSVNTGISVFSGVTQQLGSVDPTTYMTRDDSATLGSSFNFTQAGVYDAQFWSILPFDGASGLFCSLSLDTTAALLLATTNPEPWNPSIFGADLYFNWPGTSVSYVIAHGVFTVTEAMAADPNLGILRGHQNNTDGGPITEFFTDIVNNALRVERIR